MTVGGWEPIIHMLAAQCVCSIALPLIFLIISRLNENLAVALNERELLLREMTHRIKNDLTLVDSLISIQQSSETDVPHVRTLESLRNRIRNIASAHDLFSRHSGNMGNIDLDDYLDIVANGLPLFSEHQDRA